MNNAKDEFNRKKIANAIITIEVEQNNNSTKIVVRDNAGGVPIDVIDRIFEPYYTTKDQGKGIGMGLYMSKMIIENNMDGSIVVSNGDQGAVFTIEFEVVNESE